MALLHILTYIKQSIMTKLQKLYSPPRNLRVGNKSPAPFLKKCSCTGDLSPVLKIFIERPVYTTFLNPFWIFSMENDFFQTSSLNRIVPNSAFDNFNHDALLHWNRTSPQWSFTELNTTTSNGCNRSVVCGGSFIIVTIFWHAKSIVPYHIWDKRPS